MSSKKARRRERRQRETEEGRRRGFSSVSLFIVGIGIAVALTVLGAYVLGDRGPGEPPFPGAVWSPSHGHWH